MLQPLTRRPPGVALFSLAVLLVLPLAGCGEATDAAKSAANAKAATGNAVNGAKDATGAVAGAVTSQITVKS